MQNGKSSYADNNFRAMENGLVPGSHHNPATINIVLADDDVDEQQFFKTAIRELPFITQINVLSDGVYLLEYLVKSTNDKPDIIFLDIMMPRKDGIECLQEIKQHEDLKSIPIVMYSNSVGQDYIVKTYECGAQYFLQKGKYSELTESLRQLLAIINQPYKQVSLQEFQFCLHTESLR